MSGFDVECWHNGKFNIFSLELQEKIVWRSNVREGQAFSVHRRAGACPPPGCGLPDAREGQALALRYGDGGWGIGRSRGTGPRATG